ncbi:hypothetical protein CRENBAI_012875, partial [Crenichthys baileyi]
VSTFVSVLRVTPAAHLRWRTNSASKASRNLRLWLKTAATTYEQHSSPGIKSLTVS